MKQLLRRLALALSLAAALAGAQLVVTAAPAFARPGWPPIVANGGICEDGTGWLPLTSCPILVSFQEALLEDLRFYLTTLPGSAAPDEDYLPLEWELVAAPPGTVMVEVTLWIVSDMRCEEPETFTLLLSTDDPGEGVVPFDVDIMDMDCGAPPARRV